MGNINRKNMKKNGLRGIKEFPIATKRALGPFISNDEYLTVQVSIQIWGMS